MTKYDWMRSLNANSTRTDLIGQIVFYHLLHPLAKNPGIRNNSRWG